MKDCAIEWGMKLVRFALEQVTGEVGKGLVAAVGNHFSTHGDALPQAIRQAHVQAWKAVGLALQDEGALDGLRGLAAGGDLKQARDAVRGLAGVDASTRRQALKEWKAASEAGVFHNALPDSTTWLVSIETADRRSGDVAEEAALVVHEVARGLAVSYPALGRVIAAHEPSVLAVAFAYFLRAEIAKNDDLRDDLVLRGLRRLSRDQEQGLERLRFVMDPLGSRFDEVLYTLDGVRQVVMDWFDGPNLATWLNREGPLRPKDAREVARRDAEALAYVDDQGLLPRDVKPGNVLLRRDGGSWDVKLIDFRLALHVDARDPALQQALSGASPIGASVIGSMAYAPPEQTGRLPSDQVGPRSDVYGFGRTLCAMPFHDPEPPYQTPPDIPRDLVELIRHSTAYRPDERPDNMRQVLAWLSDGPSLPSFSPAVLPSDVSEADFSPRSVFPSFRPTRSPSPTPATPPSRAWPRTAARRLKVGEPAGRSGFSLGSRFPRKTGDVTDSGWVSTFLNCCRPETCSG